MISLKTVFNYIKFANELTNKVSFMFNGIKKYVVRIVCVIMLLLVQFDVCAPLIDANLAMVETMEQPTLPSIIRKSKFPQNPKRSVRFSGKGTKRSVQKRKARNTQKAETKVL